MQVSIYDTWESLPDNPSSDGVFVVMDVFKFTTTVTELLERNAANATVFQDTENLVDFHNETGHPVGGEHRQLEQNPMELCNSASYVAEHNELYDGQPVGLRSDNGAKAVHAVPIDAPLYLGSTVNAAAVADAVQNTDARRVNLVCAGSHGEPAYEDLAAAHLIERHLVGHSSLRLTTRLLRRVCETSTWVQGNGDKTEYHRGDVRRAMSVNHSDVVPVRGEGYQFTSLDSEAD